jgi:hypothetical protein
MRESEIIRKIREEGTGGHRFIKWWRTEEDWLEYDLVDRFVANAGGKATQEIEGYALVSDDEVWERAKLLCGDRLSRETENFTETIRWERDGKISTCLYTPENLLKVLDVETRGNLVD